MSSFEEVVALRRFRVGRGDDPVIQAVELMVDYRAFVGCARTGVTDEFVAAVLTCTQPTPRRASLADRLQARREMTHA